MGLVAGWTYMSGSGKGWVHVKPSSNRNPMVSLLKRRPARGGMGGTADAKALYVSASSARFSAWTRGRANATAGSNRLNGGPPIMAL